MNFPKFCRESRPTSFGAAWIGSIILVALIGASRPAGAAETNPSLIAAPSMLVVQAGAEQSVPIGVAAGSNFPKTSMFLIHGLPQTSVLSAGRVFESGTWAVRFGDLDDLRIETTLSAAGSVPLTLSVVSLDGTVLAERTMTLAVVPPGASQTQAARPASPPLQNAAPTAAASAPPSAERLEDANVLMARGTENLLQGKIHVARLFYRRAAEQGLPAGAMALAQTYDPNELARLNALGGVQPDIDQAKLWYDKAHQLGDAEAGGKLKRLTAGK